MLEEAHLLGFHDALDSGGEINENRGQIIRSLCGAKAALNVWGGDDDMGLRKEGDGAG